MSQIEKITFSAGLDDETAEWVNRQHRRMENGKRLLLGIAMSIGEVLAGLQICNSCKFAEWLEKNVRFSQRTAYNYISLHNYRNQIIEACSLTEAYKMIETLEAQKKQAETLKAIQRVAEYRDTGVKPEGWRRGTDDKLAKEEAELDEPIEAVKQEAPEQKAAKAKEQAEWEPEWEPEWDEPRAEVKQAETGRNRTQFKEKIRFSADGMKDPFQDAVLDYLEGLENDIRRIEACNNIINICRLVADELQGGKA
jgi:hypothetical protein